MKIYTHLLLLLLFVCVFASCTSVKSIYEHGEGELVLKKSTRYSALYYYNVPKWMSWIQAGEFMLELARNREIESVEGYSKDRRILMITTRGLIDPYNISEILERELAYLPGPEFQKRVLSEADFESMNLEELRFVNEHPEMFEVQSEPSGTEGRGVE